MPPKRTTPNVTQWPGKRTRNFFATPATTTNATTVARTSKAPKVPEKTIPSGTQAGPGNTANTATPAPKSTNATTGDKQKAPPKPPEAPKK